jgi:hypothetical protein
MKQTIVKTILLAVVILNLVDQIVMSPINNNSPICYNMTSGIIINSLNCTCTNGACMSTNSICPCQQTAIANCNCMYIYSTPCTG